MNTDGRMQDVLLGIDVEAFLNSVVGRYIATRAEDELQQALELLAKVSPDDPKAIRELQNQHWRANSVLGWLAEAVQVGAHAEAELTLVE